MRWILCIVTALCLTATASAQAPNTDSQPPDSALVATVNGFALSVGRFNQSYVRHLIRTGENDTPANRWAHLDKLIRTRLLGGEARRRGLDESAEYAAYAERQRKMAVGGRFFRQSIADSLTPLTEAQVRDAYRQSKGEVVLRQLYFRDPDRAQTAYERLKDGADFLELANEIYDTAEFDSAAGYLGRASYWDLDDAVAEVAFDLPTGAFSQPVRSSQGWHILRVEKRLRAPLLTESQFQYKREGVAGKLRLRRNRLVGNRFVRSFMNGLDVQVDEQGARLVAKAAGRVLEKSGKSEQRKALSNKEVESLRAELTPQTPLLTYTMDGQKHIFRAGDFFAWLPNTKHSELRNHPMVAVGRALRNEVFAQRGTAMGLDDDPRVREVIDFYTTNFLANRLREQLQTTERIEPSEEQMQEALERLGYRRLEEARADFWQIRFSSLAEAKRAKQGVESGEKTPETFETYERSTDADLTAIPLGDHIRRAPLDETLLACDDAGVCYVLKVTDRTLHYTKPEDTSGEVREKLASILPEKQLVDALRKQAAVEVNTTLFNRMMKPDDVAELENGE